VEAIDNLNNLDILLESNISIRGIKIHEYRIPMYKDDPEYKEKAVNVKRYAKMVKMGIPLFNKNKE
jgi:hypothetical protein